MCSCRACSTTTGVTGGLIEAEGVRHASMQVDITEPGAPRRVVDACAEQLGSVDILINSAGIAPLGDVLEYGRPLWDATVAVNLTAAFEMSYEAAQRMVPQRSGKIINICSRLLVPRRPAGAGVRGHEARHRRPDEDLLRRARAAQHPGQRDRTRLLRHRAHGCDPERPGPQSARARSHPDRPLGRAARPDGSGRLPREPRVGLRQRARPLGGRRLPRPLGRGRERHAWPVPDRHRRRHPEHEGRRRRRRGTRGRGGPGAAAPDEPAQARRRLPSRRRPLGLARRGEPPGAPALRRRSGRDRGRRPLHDPLLQGVPQSGRIARRAGDQLDGRPRLPALPARRPGPRVRDHLLGVSRPPPHRRVPRLGRQQHPPAVADRRGQMGLERRRCAVRAVPAAARAALRAPAAR